MECNNNRTTLVNSTAFVQQTMQNESDPTKNLQEKISSLFQELIDFLQNELPYVSKELKVFSSERKKLYEVMRFEWIVINWLFKNYCKDVTFLELLRTRVDTIASSAIISLGCEASLIDEKSEKAYTVEVINIERCPDAIPPHGLALYPQKIISEIESNKLVDAMKQYRDKIKVTKKDKKEPCYRIAEGNDIDEKNANLTFDSKLLDEIPKTTREFIMQHLKPYMFTPKDFVIYFFDKNKKMYELKREINICSIRSTEALVICECYEEMPSKICEQYNSVNVIFERDGNLKLKEKMLSNKININLTDYIKQLKQKQTQNSVAQTQCVQMQKNFWLCTLVSFIFKRHQLDARCFLYTLSNE